MSVYRRPGHTVFSYDFRRKGLRYSGSTGATTRRAAEQHEEAEKRRIDNQTVKTSGPLTVGVAIGRFWEEVGQHLKNHKTMLVNLAWIERELGKNRQLSGVSSADVARLVTTRRAQPSLVGKKPKPVSAATVNRGVVAPLRAVITRARKKWDAPVANIEWGEFLLREPQERVRELKADEERRLFAALRADYHPVARFALLSGCRREECVGLAWKDIDWHNGIFRVTGKGNKTRTIPLTPALRKLLWPLPRAHEQVFVFASKRADYAPRGSLHPVTAEGLKSIFKRATAKAGVDAFRFHDLRHTRATRLLRKTGNLKLVKELLGHEDIATTLKYAHASVEDLRDAMTAAENATEITTGDSTTGANNMVEKGE